MTDYKSKLCPFLSGAGLAAQASKPESEREAVSCQGPMCALYMSILDESGKAVVDGNCSIVLTANALSHVNLNVARTAEHFLPGSTTSTILKG